MNISLDYANINRAIVNGIADDFEDNFSLCHQHLLRKIWRARFSLMSLGCHLVERKQPPTFLLCVNLSSKSVQMNTDVELYILSGEDGLRKIILEMVMGTHKKYHF